MVEVAKCSVFSAEVMCDVSLREGVWQMRPLNVKMIGSPCPVGGACGSVVCARSIVLFEWGEGAIGVKANDVHRCRG